MFTKILSDKKYLLKTALLFLPLFVLMLLFTKDDITLSGNESSRLATVESLVEKGTFSIDASLFKTEDKVFIGGKFYSDKPLLLPLFLSGIYKALNSAGLNFRDNYNLLLYIMNFAGGGLFALLLFFLFHKAIMPLKLSFGMTSLLSAALLFGTWLLSFSATLTNHVPAAFFLFLFFLAFLKMEKSNTPQLLLFSGFISGILLNIELPAGLLAAATAAIFLLLISGRKFKDISLLTGGFAIPLLFMLSVNYLAYASILPAYAVPGAYNFPGNIHSSGMAGLNKPEPFYLFNILFGYRGIFSYMPALLFIIPYIITFRKKMRLNTVFILVFIVSFITFYSLMTGDYGGWSYGFRFFIPIIPVLWFYICEWFAVNKSRTLKFIFGFAIIWGIITSLAGSYNPWPVCYEGYATGKGTVENNIRNPFLANIFCLSHEFMNSSPLEKYLKTEVYGTEVSKIYIPKAFMNMKKFSLSDGASPREHRLGNLIIAFISVLLLAINFFFILKISQKLLNITLRNSIIAKTDYLAFLILYVFLVSGLIIAICGYSGLLRMEYILFASGVLFMLSTLLKSEAPALENHFSKNILLIAIPAIVLNSFIASVNLPLTVTNWDAMTYHLYFPSRWIQDGMIFHVPSVFGDNAPAFFPKCWMLFLTMFMAVSQSDAFLSVMPLLFLCGTAFCIFRLAVFCGVDKYISAGVAALFACLPVISEYTFTANADIPLLFFLLCAIAGLFFYIRENKITFVIICLLSCGAAAGVKTVGLLFALPIIIIVSIVILKRGKYSLLFLCPLLFIISGGWCYTENLILYGNPFFPLDLSFGPWRIFAGAYTNEAVKAGEFHSSSISILHNIIMKTYGFPTYLMIPLGLAGYICGMKKGNLFRTFSLTALILLLCWVLSYIFIIPHNTETRFLFPALALSLPGMGILLNAMPKKSLAITIILLLCFFTAVPALIIAKATAAGLQYKIIMLSALIFFTAVSSLIPLLFFRHSRKLAIYSSTIFFAMLLFSFTISKEFRVYSFRLSDYAPWLSESFKPFNLSGGIAGTIAYTGNNLPYVLAGEDMRSKVVYCNVQGALKDSFYDFWKHDKKIYNTHKPPLYRAAPNYDEWLKNIEASGASYLFLSVLYPAERKYISSDENGFPVEETWASSHKDKFIPVIAGKYIRLYNIRKDN